MDVEHSRVVGIDDSYTQRAVDARVIHTRLLEIGLPSSPHCRLDPLDECGSRGGNQPRVAEHMPHEPVVIERRELHSSAPRAHEEYRLPIARNVARTRGE